MAHYPLCWPFTWGCYIATNIKLINHGRLGWCHHRKYLNLIPWIPYYTGCFNHISKLMIVHSLRSQVMKRHRSSSLRLRQNSNNSCRAVRRVLVRGAIGLPISLNRIRCNTAMTGLAWLRTVALAVWLQWLRLLLLLDIMISHWKQNCVALAIKWMGNFMMLMLRRRVWRLHSHTSRNWLRVSIGRLLGTVWRIQGCGLRSTLRVRRRRLLLSHLSRNMLDNVLLLLHHGLLGMPSMGINLLGRHLGPVILWLRVQLSWVTRFLR